ncbi:hypothetical protein BC828DRAFT_88855 [Blastocladiella britannica]|nr:hypothetical protein BC828DRAFT_88855 [Blastocladiella britannica]
MNGNEWTRYMWQAFEDRGYKVIIERMRSGKHTAKQLVDYFTQRVALEVAYSTSLSKMTKVLVSEDIGSTHNAVDTLRIESEALSKQHADFATFLKAQVEKPLADMVARQKTTRESTLTMAEKDMRTRAACQQQYVRTKDKYMSRTTEVATLRDAQRSKYGKELEKANARLAKTEASLSQAEQEYMVAQEQLQKANKDWEANWAKALMEFEGLEVERMVSIRSNLSQFSSASRNLAVKDAESYERVRARADDLRGPDDLQLFMSKLNLAAPPPASTSITPSTSSTAMAPFPFGATGGLAPPLPGVTGFTATGSTTPPSGYMDITTATSATDTSPSTSPGPRVASALASNGLGGDGGAIPVQSTGFGAVPPQPQLQQLPADPGYMIPMPVPFVVHPTGGSMVGDLAGGLAPSQGAPMDPTLYGPPPQPQYQPQYQPPYQPPVLGSSPPPQPLGHGYAPEMAPGAWAPSDPAPAAVGGTASAETSRTAAPGVANASGELITMPADIMDAGTPAEVVCVAVGRYAYVATIDEELSFAAGDELQVLIQHPDGWWLAETTRDPRTPGVKRRGLIPSNFVMARDP